MNDLIWIGNSLVPRWWVFAPIVLLFIIGIVAAFMRDKEPGQ